MSTSQTPEMSIPSGSLILVSGATGFVASHVVEQLLERGFRVRGSVRSFESAAWLLSAHEAAARSGQLELVKVPDITVEGAFDEAVKGVAGILHIASPTGDADGGFDTDASVAVPRTVNAMKSIFNSALKEKSVKEFVFTGTIMSATFPLRGNTTHVGPETYNEDAVAAAYAPPPYEATRGFMVYAAGKVAAEKEFRRLMAESNPGFVGNILSPSGIIGEPKHAKHANAHHNWIKSAYRSEQERFESFPTAYFADVKDLALLHIATMLDPAVNNERLQIWGVNIHWNSFLKVLRRLRPEKQWVTDLPNSGLLDITTDQSIPESLLEKWGNKKWTPLEQTLEESVNSPYFKYGVELS